MHVNNLILRVENSDKSPHLELENIGNPNVTTVWIKDYAIDEENYSEIYFYDCLSDILRIASEIKQGDIFIHVGFWGDDFIYFSFSKEIIKKIALYNCTLEICLDSTDYSFLAK